VQFKQNSHNAPQPQTNANVFSIQQSLEMFKTDHSRNAASTKLLSPILNLSYYPKSEWTCLNISRVPKIPKNTELQFVFTIWACTEWKW